MSIVSNRRNNQRALVALGAAAVGNYVGQVAFSSTGKKLIYDGVKYVAAKLWNKKWKNGKAKDLISHPGAMPGAVAAPVAISRIIRASRPKFRKGVGAVTVTHRELVGQFDTSVGLRVNDGVVGNVYKLNPLNGSLFPWLLQLATNFDQYKFESVRLQYVPLCNTATTGRVALYFDKDSGDTEPGDRIELANMGHLTETSPWAEASLNIPTDTIKRFTSDSSTADPKLINLGQVGIATYGGPVTDTAAGDLFIHYTVTFFEPQPSAGIIGTTSIGATNVQVGPKYVDIAANPTTIGISFRSPGTYFVAVTLTATSVTSITAATGATINTETHVTAGGEAIALINLKVDAIGSGVAILGLGFDRVTVNAVRAVKANSGFLT